MADIDSLAVNKLWWEEDPEEQYAHVFGVTDTITENIVWRTQEFLVNTKYYLNREVKSLEASCLLGVDAGLSFRSGMTYNVVKMAIDAIAARIAKQKPRVFFLTNEGRFDQQERAKSLTRYMDAIFEENKLYMVAQNVFKEMCIFGTGCVKVSPDPAGKKILIEKVNIKDILVDEIEASDGEPEQLHHRRYVPRYKLKQMFPKWKEQIEAVEEARLDDVTLSDRIEVIESWKRPSISGGDDGRHTICIKNATLLSEEYNNDRFPFAFMRWSNPLQGFYGESLVTEIRDIQDALNEVLGSIIDGQTLMAKPRWFVHSASKIDEGELNDQLGQIVRYSGDSPPVAGVAPGASPELYQFADQLFERAFEVAGVSLLSATSRKPAGIESGKAMMVYSDIETERFNLTGQAYQQFFLDIADLVIDTSKQLYGNSKKAEVPLRDKDKYYSTAYWKDIDLERDKFQLSKYSTNFLPKEPAGQLETVVNMVKANMIPPEESMALLDYPDTGHFYHKATASLRIAEKVIDSILIHGKMIPPERYMNLELLAKTAQERYLDAMLDDEIPGANLELLQNFMDQVAEMLTPAAPAAPPPGPTAAPPMGPEPMDPAAPPMMPPA